MSKSNNIILAGGHIGPPLQSFESTLNKVVGEHRCVLPHIIIGDKFLGNHRKKMVLAVEPYHVLERVRSNGRIVH